MDIRRYCGKERLPGGERLWRKLAKLAGFDGKVLVYGYGVKGIGGREQRQFYRGNRESATIGHYDSELNQIRVWLPCSCQAVEFDQEVDIYESDRPLETYAHELGHHCQHVEGALLDEAGADKRGAHLLNAARL